MKNIILISCFIVMTITTNAQQSDFPKLSGPYLGQKPPGDIPEIFAPGFISTPDKNEFCASFSPDGTEFYFNRNMEIMVCTLKNGKWSFPEPATFSSGFRAHEAHITFDNSRVFWGWFKDGGYSVYYAERVEGGWSEARNAGMDGRCYSVTSDQSGKLHITKNGPGVTPVIAGTELKDGKFTDLIPIEGEVNNTEGVENSRGFRNMAHPGISPDGSYILFDCNGGSHLWVTFRYADGKWSEAIDMSKYGIDKEFGTPTISRDGKYIFFSGYGDIYWVSAKIIEELRPKE